MNATPVVSAPVGPFEKFLSQIESQPFGALYRALIGFLLVPVYRRLIGSDDSTAFVLFFLCVLVMIRVLPLVFRKLLPFSKEIQLLWFSRRNLAKEYDSFQWRKLFWIGLGMAAYMAVYGDRANAHWAIAAVCIVGGAAAHWIWRRLPAAKQTI